MVDRYNSNCIKILSGVSICLSLYIRISTFNAQANIYDSSKFNDLIKKKKRKKENTIIFHVTLIELKCYIGS